MKKRRSVEGRGLKEEEEEEGEKEEKEEEGK